MAGRASKLQPSRMPSELCRIFLIHTLPCISCRHPYRHRIYKPSMLCKLEPLQSSEGREAAAVELPFYLLVLPTEAAWSLVWCSPDYAGSCGRCYEMRCANMVFKGVLHAELANSSPAVAEHPVAIHRIKATHLMLMMAMMTCLNACECELGKVNSVEHTVYPNCAKTTCSQSAACMRGEACR